MSAPLAFTDTETSSLSAEQGHAWEIAVIRRDQDGTDTEHLWQIRIDLATADPDSLRISRYHQRFAVPAGIDAVQVMPDGGLWKLTLPELLFDIHDALADAVLIGSNPAFDDRFISKLLRAHGRKTPWHYRPIDIATLAAGYEYGRAASNPGGDYLFPSDFPQHPYSSRALSRAVGVEPPGDNVAHTALGDARWARDVHDAVTGWKPPTDV